MMSGPLVNRFWNGDFGSSVDIPLNAIRGGEGSPSSIGSSSGDEEGMLFRMAYGTAGQAAPSGGGLYDVSVYAMRRATSILQTLGWVKVGV